MSFELYFRDLNEDAQQRLLEFYGLQSPEEGNLDITPIAILETE